ncbi:hypothetical protein pb186bvf_013491 [Paramecium bursaria]
MLIQLLIIKQTQFMFQKLIEPFKQKVKVVGDLPVQFTQNTTIPPSAHTNQLTIQAQKVIYQWYRNEKPIDNNTNEYKFQISDVGRTIKCVVQNDKQKSTLQIGPICLDEQVRQSFLNILNSGVLKFPINIEGIRVFHDGRLIEEIKQQTMSTIQFLDNQIKIQENIKQSITTIQSNDIEIVEYGDKIVIKFTSGINADLQKFLKLIFNQEVKQFHDIHLTISSSSQKQRDSLILAYYTSIAKSVIINYKFVQQLDRVCVLDFSETTFQAPTDFQLCIAALQQQLQFANKKKTNQCKYILQQGFRNKMMEDELSATIQSYQQILQQNNLNGTEKFNQSLTKSLKKSSIEMKKSMLLESENQQLKDKIKQLMQVQLVENQTQLSQMTKDQLIRKIQELEQNLHKSKRLNEIINKQLNDIQDQKNLLQEVEFLRQQNTQLEYKAELLEEYREKILKQQQDINKLQNKLNQQEPNDTSSHYIQQLESEIDNLRNMTERTDTMSFFELKNNGTNSYEEISELKELVQKQKNQIRSLRREIEQLSKNPTQANVVRNHFEDKDKIILDLKQQVKLLEQEISMIRDGSYRNSIQSTQGRNATETSRQSVSPMNRSEARSVYTKIFEQLPPPIIKSRMTSKHRQNYSQI